MKCVREAISFSSGQYMLLYHEKRTLVTLFSDYETWSLTRGSFKTYSPNSNSKHSKHNTNMKFVTCLIFNSLTCIHYHSRSHALHHFYLSDKQPPFSPVEVVPKSNVIFKGMYWGILVALLAQMQVESPGCPLFEYGTGPLSHGIRLDFLLNHPPSLFHLSTDFQIKTEKNSPDQSGFRRVTTFLLTL